MSMMLEGREGGPAGGGDRLPAHEDLLREQEQLAMRMRAAWRQRDAQEVARLSEQQMALAAAIAELAERRRQGDLLALAHGYSTWRGILQAAVAALPWWRCRLTSARTS